MAAHTGSMGGMEIAALIFSSMLLLLGGFLTFIPMTPGPLIAWSGLLVCHLLWPEGPVGTMTLLLGLFLVALAKAVDFFAGVWGARRYGASWAGAWGALVGGLVFTALGLLTGVGLLAGALMGPALGAILAEMLFGRTWREAMKSGWGTFVGFAVSVLFSLMVCGVLLAVFSLQLLVFLMN